MNEILLTAPSIGKPEWLACKERTVNLAQRLEAVLKEEDPGRASVMAFNMTNLYNEIGLNLVWIAARHAVSRRSFTLLDYQRV